MLDLAVQIVTQYLQRINHWNRLVKKYNAVACFDQQVLMVDKGKISFGKMQTIEMKDVSHEDMEIPPRTLVPNTGRPEISSEKKG